MHNIELELRKADKTYTTHRPRRLRDRSNRFRHNNRHLPRPHPLPARQRPRIPNIPIPLLLVRLLPTPLESPCQPSNLSNWPVRQSNGSTVTQQAIIFGLGSMFNHSARGQNVLWTRDLAREVVVYTAGRDIAAGEELCISYGSNLWFKDADGATTPPETEGKMLEGYDFLYDTSLDGE